MYDTNYDMVTTMHAVNFLINSLSNTLNHHKNMKQVEYLLENDIMSDEEWQIYLEQRWVDIFVIERN
mgnify:CR=1 FL=1